MTLTVGSLFAGIGGFDLAARWMGWRTIWVSEIDPYCNRILAREWPDAPNLGDITKIDWSTVARPDLLCGGFPCQPHSVAGKRKAGADSRDLWGECARAVRELRPDYAVFENVPGLLTSEGGRFFNRVLSDLAALGYDAEWQVLSAADVGAPHRRERVWIMAYPIGQRGCGGHHPWTDAADADPSGEGIATGVDRRWWATEPNVGRVANGIPHRVDRLRALGNSIVPACAYRIFQQLAEAGGCVNVTQTSPGTPYMAKPGICQI